MSEGRKRSRKSKLEVREDDCEFVILTEENDDTNTAAVAAAAQKPANVKNEIYYYTDSISISIKEHDYCKPAKRVYAIHTKPNKSIKAPKYSAFDKSTIIALKKTDTDSLQKGVKLEVEQFDVTEQFRDKKPSTLLQMDLNINEMYNGKRDEKIRMCKYKPELLFEESKRLAESTNNIADKILDVEMRNLWGNVLVTPNKVDETESKLQVAIEEWQTWLNGAKFVRDTPLFYQCHICQTAWWTLQPFREHIRCHPSDKLMISLKENLHESFIIASYDIVDSLLYIDIEDNCYRCGRDVKFHKQLNAMNICSSYMCSRCCKSQYTCSALVEHESSCLYPNFKNFNVSAKRQCIICKNVMDSLSLVEQHMIAAHSVRSDLPAQIMSKKCMNCHEKYFTYSIHSCSKSNKNAGCEHCCRKFSSNKLAVAHVHSRYNRPIHCRICGEKLKAKCQEMEHLLSNHTMNYKLAFKCTICTEQHLLFLDDKSIKLHRQLWHLKKYDKRRLYFEMMLVPKTCLDEENVEEAILPDGFCNDHDYETVFHGDDLLESTDTKKLIRIQESNADDDFSLPQSFRNVASDVDVMVNEIDVSLPQSFRNVASDVDVMVNEIDVKKEPVDFSENGDVDYEELLQKMFNQSAEEIPEHSGKKAGTKIEANMPKIEKVETLGKSAEFDFGSVRIKTEPVDDIDITEHPIEVQIKSEPVDPEDNEFEAMEVCWNDVKVESINEDNDVKPVNNGTEIVVKQEVDDEIETKYVIKTEAASSSQMPFDDFMSELEMFNGVETIKKGKNHVQIDDRTYEYSVDVINPSGLFKQKKMYTCLKCGYTAQQKQYRKHMKANCSVSPGINSSYPCTKCGLTFVMFNNYVIHFEKHGFEINSCFVCGTACSTILKLLSHVHRHIKNMFVPLHVLNKTGEEVSRQTKQVKCQECKKIIHREETFSHWEKHLKLRQDDDVGQESGVQVKEETPELTVDCERVTMNNKELEPAVLKSALEHLQSEMAEKECIICYRLFARRYDLKRHIVEHLLMDAHMKKAKFRSFRCQICSAGFPHPEKYKFHMRGHGAMPIFKCELCNKTFSDSSNFAKHKKTHNVRVLICDICRKKFHSKPALEKHIAEHETLPLTKCPLCPRTFHTKSSFKKHRYQIHMKNKYKCVLCDLLFNSLQHKWDHNWEVHQERKHAADCPICLKSFRKFHDVKAHARTEHGAEVAVIKAQKQSGVQLFKIKDLKVDNEMLLVYEGTNKCRVK